MSRLLSPLVVVAALAAACSVSEAGPATAGPDARGGIGKADLIGSCALPNGEDHCGAKGSGNCWCDEACVDYGDCCGDADDVCGIGEPDPGQFCGGIANIQCPVGEVCVGVGNFPDAGGTCEPAPFCGGFAGLACPEGLICVDVPGDGCDPPQGADCGGMCVPPPESCQAADCGPAPGAPSVECWDGSVGGPVCDFTDEGACGWTIVECPDAPGGPSCEGNCGGSADSGACWCDSLCQGYGDCCDDYVEACTEPAGVPCGDTECGTDEVCVTHVTQVGPMTACAPIPDACEEGVASCACMGQDVCTGAFNLCNDDPEGGLSCGCPVC